MPCPSSGARAPHTWPAMEVLGAAAAGRMGRPVAEAEIIEVYSCFPAAVRVQQRSLGLRPPPRPPSPGGWPSPAARSTTSSCSRWSRSSGSLRAEPGSLGVVTTVSGLLTKPGLGVWSGTPDGRPPLLARPGRVRPRSATGVLDVVETLDGYDGEATVATYTVTFEGMVPVRTVAVCDTDDGRRCVAVAEDPGAGGPRPSTTELIGARVRLDRGRLVLLL